jgi:hypothetical protein
MKLPILGRAIDERFLDRRRRSTSTAGIIGAILSVVLFEYRYFVNHIWSWDLLAVALTFVVIKMAMMTWYWLKD